MSDVKVRQAMYLAIDEGTIIKNIMNGCAYEMNSVVPEDYVGYTEVTREAYDPEKAKELLAEAGYPDGFEVTFDAPNDRYMNDEQIAQAVAGYLEKVGIKVNLNLMPKANFFSYIKPLENKSMFLMTGWLMLLVMDFLLCTICFTPMTVRQVMAVSTEDITPTRR